MNTKTIAHMAGILTSAIQAGDRLELDALKGPALADMDLDRIRDIKRDCSTCINLLEQIPLLLVNRPQGAFYIFPDVSAYFGRTSTGGYHVKDADDMSLYLLAEARVSTVSGVAFGNEKCIRLSYATSDEKLKDAAERISKALSILI